MALANLPDIAAVGATTHGNVRTKVNDVATSVTIMSRRFVRSYSLADMVSGYSTNVPLLIGNNADTSKTSPEAHTYPVGTYNSAPALYDLVTQCYAAYPTTGFEIIIPTGYWALGSKPNAALNHIIPILPRMTIRGETGNPVNCQLVRSNSVLAHMFGTTQTTGMGGTVDELFDVVFREVGLNGNWVNGAYGTGQDWDIINWVKPISNPWFDSRLWVWRCSLEKAKRHCIYYSARGDSRILENRFEGSGDSAIKIVNSPDSHCNQNHIVAAGRHALEVVDTTNWEMFGNICYFCGQNQLNRWDGSNAETVRREGSVIYLENCGSIRGFGNRIEDNTGHGIVLNSPGAVYLKDTYFSSIGTVGANAQRLLSPKEKDFAASGANITATVNGVDCVVIERSPSNGNKLGDGVYIHGYVRSARDCQQVRYLLNIDPPNATWRPGRDMQIDFQPWPDEFAGMPMNVDDTDRWTERGLKTFWVAPANLVSNNWPGVFERSRFTWKGELMAAIHGRNQYLRRSELNPYEAEIVYDINVASATASATSATFSGTTAAMDRAVTYALSADLTGTIGVKHAVRITGMTKSINNGIFNVKAITANSITVHNPARWNATDDETGSSGTVVGPSPALILDTGFGERAYRIRVAGKSASTESLRLIKASDGSTLKTITTTGTTTVRKSLFTGWEEI